MNRYQLEMFIMVVDTKKISTAAKLLNISQPGLSSQIKTIESYYNAQLLARTKNGVEPTPAGQVFYRYAKKILSMYDVMEKEIDDLLGIQDQVVNIGATYTVGNYAIPCSIWTFKEKYPKVALQLEVSNTHDIINRLLSHKFHLAIVEGPVDIPEEADLTCKLAANDEIVFIAPPTKDWENTAMCSLADLVDVPLILPSPGSGVREVFDKSLLDAGMTVQDFRVVSQMSSIEAIKSAVEAGMGISLCTRMAVQKELRRNALWEIPVHLSIPVQFRIFYHNNGYLPAMAQRFIRFIAGPEELSLCEKK